MLYYCARSPNVLFLEGGASCWVDRRKKLAAAAAAAAAAAQIHTSPDRLYLMSFECLLKNEETGRHFDLKHYYLD